MKSVVKAIALAALVALPLSGCNTTGASSHGNYSDHPSAQSSNHDPITTGNTSTIGSPKSDFVSLKGDSSKRLLELGKENFTSQNYGLSERYFREAVSVRTDNAAAWAGLAASYDQLGNFEKADRAYKALVDLKGNDPRVLNNIGYSYLLRGEYKKARNYFNRAQSANPGLEQVQGNLHLLEKVINS